MSKNISTVMLYFVRFGTEKSMRGGRMNRREFLKKSLSMGVAAAGTLFLEGNFNKLFAGESAEGIPDLVAVKGGEPEDMFKEGIKAIGGIERFVKKGQVVLVKPNIGWDQMPEVGANTNPKLVQEIVEQCFKAGASKVYMFDRTCDYWESCYTKSGMREVAKKTGAELLSGDKLSDYRRVVVNGAKVLKETKIHRLLEECDVFINVPILKHHSSTRLSIAMKNLMGVVWDRDFYHMRNLDTAIAEFCLYKKPHLNIVDAYRVMMKYGPRGIGTANTAVMKTLLISPDIVAIDAAAAMVFGAKPEEIRYIKAAHELKIGNMNIGDLNVKKINI
jgi:uncharacterized protein (DUF362 family)